MNALGHTSEETVTLKKLSLLKCGWIFP